MPSWLDLIGVGIDAAQSYHIYQARQELRQIESGLAAEANRAMVLEIMRNFVFELAQDVKALDEHVERTPQQVYVVARALDWRLQDSGITPEIFPEFADKEYVQRTCTMIAAALEQSRSRLTAQQLEDAEEAFLYISEASLLNRAIETKSLMEQYKATEEEWKELSEEAKRLSNKRTLGWVALVGTFVVLPPFGCLLISLLGNSSTLLFGETFGLIGGSVGTISLLVVFLTAFIGSLVLITKNSAPQRYKELRDARAAWSDRMMPREEWDRVVNLWGDLPSESYRNMQVQRNNLLREMFGQTDGFEKFLPGSK